MPMFRAGEREIMGVSEGVRRWVGDGDDSADAGAGGRVQVARWWGWDGRKVRVRYVQVDFRWNWDMASWRIWRFERIQEEAGWRVVVGVWVAWFSTSVVFVVVFVFVSYCTWKICKVAPRGRATWKGVFVFQISW